MNFSFQNTLNHLRDRMFSTPTREAAALENTSMLGAERAAATNAIKPLEEALARATAKVDAERAKLQGVQANRGACAVDWEANPTTEALTAYEQAQLTERQQRFLVETLEKKVTAAANALDAQRTNVERIEAQIASNALETVHAKITTRAHAMATELQMLLAEYTEAHAAAPLTDEGHGFSMARKAGPAPHEMRTAIAQLFR